MVSYKKQIIEETLKIINITPPPKATIEELLDILEKSKPKYSAGPIELEMLQLIDKIINSIRNDEGPEKANELLAKLKDDLVFDRDWD
ncbi:MAG: hypothetical protein M1291_07005 [Thaumarchaeota archaeon]|nr:hypothetical protein [Nitrososphaerota archaeon]